MNGRPALRPPGTSIDHRTASGVHRIDLDESGILMERSFSGEAIGVID